MNRPIFCSFDGVDCNVVSDRLIGETILSEVIAFPHFCFGDVTNAMTRQFQLGTNLVVMALKAVRINKSKRFLRDTGLSVFNFRER